MEGEEGQKQEVALGRHSLHQVKNTSSLRSTDGSLLVHAASLISTPAMLLAHNVF